MIRATHVGGLRVLMTMVMALGLMISPVSSMAAPGDTRFQPNPSLAALASDCRAGFGFACADLGANYEVRADIQSKRKALRLYTQACRLGESRGCALADRLCASVSDLRVIESHKAERSRALPKARRILAAERKLSAKGKAQATKTKPAAAASPVRNAGSPTPAGSAAPAPKSETAAPGRAPVQYTQNPSNRAFSANGPADASQATKTIKASFQLPWKLPGWSRLSWPHWTLPHWKWPHWSFPRWRWIGFKWPFFATHATSKASPDAGPALRKGAKAARTGALTPSAASPFSAGCNAGESDACLKEGQFFSGETGGAKNTPAALSAYQRACALNNASGCFALGTIYESGNGVRPDFDKAMSYYRQACAVGNQFACSMTTSAPPIAVTESSR